MADIDCSNLEITPIQAARKLVGVADDGCPAWRVREVAPLGDVCDDYFTCNNTEEDWKTTFFKMIDIDVNGCWAWKVLPA